VTRALPFTKASLKRAIEAARESGLRVTGIRSDGTLMTEEASARAEPEREQIEPRVEVVF
jgi:hypothetical protein